ncbi:uncharacterized protein LAJ45_08416 [Morchella importuna]|uniref:Mitochondrial outer membrane protein n=1 Tax=Morchella conica CCBAS932 TaxID=1392247 RepID=A0A3N4KNP3_9PEZI|nr:uncharacterized protein LAJ45_08416 [Morchella importuna]KAH8147588.1 hypothetical protein LAJ45_08416 [Morchella importuna]RPB07405.1 hypothetical protein P167DRAFT_540150 [Morchella conica CCBAS932]
MSSFNIPPMLKRVFDSFPLLILPDDPLPSGYLQPSKDKPLLYVFTTPADAAAGKPSFNPSCLKWQTYLKLCGIDCRIVPSSNHASPSGALPFLISAAAAPSSATKTISVGALRKWAAENGSAPNEIPEKEQPRVQAFLAMLNSQIRDAWLHSLYLSPTNFVTITSPQYRSTTVSAVNLILSHQMQAAATKELLKARPGGIINPDDIYADAESAVSALSAVLGEDEWFFGAEEPGYFDAAVFGYTHLVLATEWDEGEAGLMRAVKGHANLVAHEERICRTCFPGTSVREK